MEIFNFWCKYKHNEKIKKQTLLTIFIFNFNKNNYNVFIDILSFNKTNIRGMVFLQQLWGGGGGSHHHQRLS